MSRAERDDLVEFNRNPCEVLLFQRCRLIWRNICDRWRACNCIGFMSAGDTRNLGNSAYLISTQVFPEAKFTSTYYLQLHVWGFNIIQHLRSLGLQETVFRTYWNLHAILAHAEWWEMKQLYPFSPPKQSGIQHKANWPKNKWSWKFFLESNSSYPAQKKGTHTR